MEKIYAFTNEFIQKYPELYSFDGANVLSILGSADQYFTALLNNAKEIELMDINIVSWYHFLLKREAIKKLSYDKFCEFFITNKTNDLLTYSLLRTSLPTNARKYFDCLKALRIKFSSIRINTTITSLFSKEEYQRYIPYLEENNYYKLQELLNKTKLPIFYQTDFIKYYQHLEDKYDIMLLSNIYHWPGLEPKEYKEILDYFNKPIVQALYSWKKSQEYEEFKSLGFKIDEIPPVNLSEFSPNNYVLTYKKIK